MPLTWHRLTVLRAQPCFAHEVMCLGVFTGNISERDDVIAGRESLITGRTKQWPSNYSLHCFVLWSDRVVNWIVFYRSQHINETQNEEKTKLQRQTLCQTGGVADRKRKTMSTLMRQKETLETYYLSDHPHVIVCFSAVRGKPGKVQ